MFRQPFIAFLVWMSVFCTWMGMVDLRQARHMLSGTATLRGARISLACGLVFAVCVGLVGWN